MLSVPSAGTLTFRIKLQLLHFQSSARSAKKSNDFFALFDLFGKVHDTIYPVGLMLFNSNSYPLIMRFENILTMP